MSKFEVDIWKNPFNYNKQFKVQRGGCLEKKALKSKRKCAQWFRTACRTHLKLMGTDHNSVERMQWNFVDVKGFLEIKWMRSCGKYFVSAGGGGNRHKNGCMVFNN